MTDRREFDDDDPPGYVSNRQLLTDTIGRTIDGISFGSEIVEGESQEYIVLHFRDGTRLELEAETFVVSVTGGLSQN